ncbi:MAG: hypothetical protein R2806_09745 [Saprospiraceae bacterium]
MDTVPHYESIDWLMQAHMLLLLIPDVVNAEGILTGKLFEYLASRRTILCIGPLLGGAAKILQETRSGRTFTRQDEAGIRQFVRTRCSFLPRENGATVG